MSVSSSTLIKTTSDHYPLLLQFETSETSFASSFKFLKMWSLHSDCKDFISSCWQSDFVGCPMLNLSKKLKLLKSKLKVWNKETFGNVHQYVKNSELKLNLIQTRIHTNGPSDDLLNLEKTAQNDLNIALERQECFWREKSKVKWHLEGDRNTGYFHRLSQIKNKTKLISSLRVGENLISDPHLISEHIVDYFKNLYCTNNFLQEQSLVEEVIPKIIDDNTNNLLTMLPTHAEIKVVVFNLNKDGAPGPDGFRAFFFQTYWDIVQKDFIDAIMQFFITGWILPNFNSNTLILIPKHPNADSVEQFRSIAMANFKFKVISKIIADRLASILPSIVSSNQKGFIKGRNIKDCLCLASEAINLLDKKAYGGNLALKIDITKAFDTLDWGFLLKVLSCFGFNQTFCNWIASILSSASLSISINGMQQGYFNCSRGVRQGDPPSPLLLCLAEEVLSRGITKLVEEGKIKLISGARNTQIPSHCFYADDIMIYCRGNFESLQALKNLFTRYANCAGQVISARKSTIFAGGITQGRLQNIIDLLGFEVGTLPFNYLGVPIFKGRPKVSYLQPIADKVKAKLAAWKASLLSIAGRAQLIKSVIFSMLTHSMSIYSWPISLLKTIEKWFRNFLWSGEVTKRKLVTVAWKKVCKPYDEGGLGFRSLICLNESFNLKLCWDLMHSQEEWANILKARVIRRNKVINHHIYSSIWTGIKSEHWNIMENSRWLIGNGRNIHFWNDSWFRVPLADHLNLTPMEISSYPKYVVDYISNFHWHIPEGILIQHPELRSLASKVTIPREESDDRLIWKHNSNGELSLKDSYEFKRQVANKVQWAAYIWSKDIPPSKSLLVWRLLNDKIPTDEKLAVRGLHFPSMCSLCFKHTESTFHLFFECEFAFKMWCWLTSILDTPLQFQSIPDILTICDRGWSPQSKIVLQATVINILSTIWYNRNQSRFNDKKPYWRLAINNIISAVLLSGNNTTKASNSSIKDFVLLKKFNIKIKPPKPPIIKEVIWSPPIADWIKCNTDGSSSNNTSSCGGIFRNHESKFLACFAERLDNGSAIFAELSAVMRAIEIAHQRGWWKLWIETDSALVVLASKNLGLIPCVLRNRWKNCLILLQQMNYVITHIFREGNNFADKLASIGLTIQALTIWMKIPSFLNNLYAHDRLGLPNFRLVNF